MTAFNSAFYQRFSQALGALRPEDVRVFLGTNFFWSMEQLRSEDFTRAESRNAQAGLMLNPGIVAMQRTVGVPAVGLAERSVELTTLMTWLGEMPPETPSLVALGAHRIARLDGRELQVWLHQLGLSFTDFVGESTTDRREVASTCTGLWLGRLVLAGMEGHPRETAVRVAQQAAQEWLVLPDHMFLSPVWLATTRDLASSDRWPWRDAVDPSGEQTTSIGREAVQASLKMVNPGHVALFLEGHTDPIILRELDSDRDSNGNVSVDAMFRGAIAALVAAANGQPRDLDVEMDPVAIYGAVSLNAGALERSSPDPVGVFIRRLRGMLEAHLAPESRSDIDRVLLATKFSLMTALARGITTSPNTQEMSAAVWFMNHFGFEP